MFSTILCEYLMLMVDPANTMVLYYYSLFILLAAVVSFFVREEAREAVHSYFKRSLVGLTAIDTED